MSESHVALALALGLTGASYPAAAPAFRLADVSGEVRVSAPKTGVAAELPDIPSGSRVTVVNGYARIDSDLPATIWLEKGDEVSLTAIGSPASGAMITASGTHSVGVEAGESRMLLDAGRAVIVRRLDQGHMGLEAASGEVEIEGPGWSRVLARGEKVALHAGPPGFHGDGVELARLTTARVPRAGGETLAIHSPRLTLGEATRLPEREGDWSMGQEPDLRSALNAKPAGEEVQHDRVISAMFAGMMFLGAWWWARKCA